MKRSFKLSYIVLIIIIAISSCLKDDHSENLETEMRLLKQFIIDKNYNVAPTASGLYYIEQVAGTGVQPAMGDFLLLNYTGRLLEGEAIFGTTDYAIAEEFDIVNTMLLYGPAKLQSGIISPYGVLEGLMKMKEGGKSRLVFPSTLGYGRNPISTIPAYSSLIYDIELVKVIPDPVAYENEMIQKYLTDNQLSQVPDLEGVYFFETVAGTGENPLNVNSVDVIYTTYLTDGRTIATTGTTAKRFLLDDYLQSYAHPSYTVRGLRDAIKMMKKGGKATVIVPYNLAFGTTSVDATGLGYKYPVPAYSTLIFDIELVNIY